ncbi:acetyl-CoA synthetase-like protein [Ramaria rubella]|nr:acetyl-CoA synthetase-like protein [Ramaria rubella]
MVSHYISDTITHYTFGCGILRSGCTTFHISTRNSPAAIAHLLTLTNCHHIFVSEDAAMEGVCSAARTILDSQGRSLSVYKVPSYTDLYTRSDLQLSISIPLEEDPDRTAIILHSSGSTDFPKPVYVTHRIFMQWMRHPGMKVTPRINSLHNTYAIPGFADGDLSQDIMGAFTGMSVACFPPVSPPVQPTPDAVLRSVVATKSTLVFSVPSFLEHWVESADNILHLLRLKAVIVSGAALSNAVGKLLAERQIPVVQVYGSTEIGTGSVFMPKLPRFEDWDYMRLPYHLDYALVPQPDDEDIHELIFLENENRKPCVFNTTLHGKPAYATNDLLLRHPTDPQLWKIYGRKDEQIILSTGEKTNPGPIETTLCRDPRVALALVFGRGREMNGAIVQPPTEYVFDPSNSEALATYRNLIWNMIVVASPSKPFDLTAKGTPRRSFIIAAYEQEIEKTYIAAQGSSQSDIVPPSRWDADSILSYIRNVVSNVMHEQIEDETDIFQHGCDSLQATWIRNTIRHAVRTSHAASRWEILQSLVYDHPSIYALAHYITGLISSAAVHSPRGPEETTKAMRYLAVEFSQKFLPCPLPSRNPRFEETRDTVLVTGTTGALGSHLLAQLILLPEISRIYALNRRGRDGISLQARQRSSLEDRGLDVSLLASPKLVLVQTDVSQPALGLPDLLYNEVTWRVDFKILLPSFKSNIQGVRNLIDLALSSPHSSPPGFVFISSVSVLKNWNSPGLVPEAAVDAKIAVGSGYSESKWVAETVLQSARQSTSLRPTIVRIDQLSGAKNGSWNQTDSIPAIVRSGQVLGCLPDRTDDIAWLPVDIASTSIINIRDSGVPYIHLRNPRPIPWHTVFDAFSKILGVRLVSYDEWLCHLTNKNEELELGIVDARVTSDNPALQLLEFYRSIGQNKGPITTPMDMSQALQLCHSLNKPELTSALSEEEVRKWVLYWKRKGLLEG